MLKKRVSDRIQINFQISILMLILSVICLTTVSFLFSVLSVYRNVGTENAELIFDDASVIIGERFESQLVKTVHLAEITGALPEFRQPVEGNGLEHPGLPFMIRLLNSEPFLYSIYSGYADGGFIQLIKSAGNRIILDVHGAPDGTEYIVRTITGSGTERIQNWLFLDSDLAEVGEKAEKQPDYDPSARPWFKLARDNPGKALITPPYVFNSLKKPGLTVSAVVSDEAVIGIDITLEELRSMINGMHVSDNAGLLLLDGADRILAVNQHMTGYLGISSEPLAPLGARGTENLKALTENRSFLYREIDNDFQGGRHQIQDDNCRSRRRFS